MKKIAASSAILSTLLTLAFTLILTSCSGEELLRTESPLPEGHLTVAVTEPVVTVPQEIFNQEVGESYDVEAQPSASVTAADGNVLTAQALHGNVTNLSTSYSDNTGNRRTVIVIAYGKAENGETLRSETKYVQQVIAEEPEPEDEYTYKVEQLRDRVDNAEMGNAEEVKNAQTYEIIRFKNGNRDKSWKVSLAKWSYLYSKGAVKEVYTASDAAWQAAVYLPEGAAKNSLGEDIKLAHGTTSETTALKANIFDAEGNKIGEDMECISAEKKQMLYYGDITFVTTANARISAECTFQLTTVSNVVFTDAETGHREVIVGTTNGTLALAGDAYEANPEMSSQITGSDGKVYSFKGDYTVKVNVTIENENVFTSKTKYHTYTWTGK